MSAVGMSSGPRAGAKEWLGLAVLLLPTVLLFLAMTVLFLATPQIATDLVPSSSQLLWINDVYGLVMAGLLVAMGTLGDRLGRRRIMLLGAAAFGLASVAAAFAPDAAWLIAARAVMGVGAAAVMPSTLSLISNMFRDDRQRGTAIGLWAASISVGVAVGPLVGGLLVESFWWGAALLIGVPVMALVLVATPFLVPEYKAARAGTLDVASVLLSMASLLPIVYGIKEMAKHGLTVTATVTTVVGLLLSVAFVRRQLKLASPLLDVRLFANRTFSGGLGVLLFSAIALGGVYLLFTQYLQLVAGLSPLESGLWILPAALALVVVSMVSPKIARRVRPAYVLAGGSLFSLAGYIVLTQAEAPGLPLMILGFYLLYPGIAPTMALTTSLVIGAAPPEKAGAASAVTTTASDLGTSLGIALLGSLGAAVYRSAVPDSLPSAAADTLPGALTAAETLPAAQASALVDVARDAFTEGLNVAAGAAALLVTLAIVIALTLLRRIPASGEPAPSGEPRQPETAGV
ncbi:MFS transporter [Nonomuraea candida]|uniref:MFS transporter n=1 Tax=Nonomuraea candida TaxID=359159 RepID=UPI0005B9591E|nr:MFS transporter [Nonomuraea candida]